MSHEMTCPRCGAKGKTRDRPPDGTKIICVHCREPFIHRDKVGPSEADTELEPQGPPPPLRIVW